MRLSIDLNDAWRRLVARGAMRNTFTDASGRGIEAGVRLGPDGPESYATAVDTGEAACEPAERTRFASGMELLYNPVARLKPHTPPATAGRQADIAAGPDACPLACQDPDNPLSILRRASLAEIPCPNGPWRAYPNVAPWEARGLAIWIPGPADPAVRTLPHTPQVLRQDSLEDFVAIARAAGGMTTFFNSLHGGASANHLHFQAVYYDQPLAVESANRRLQGRYTVLDGYPASGLFFPADVPPEELWKAVAALQAEEYPFNLIALASGIYLFARDPRHEVLEDFPGRAFGAINLAGLFITSDPEERQRVSDATIASAYRRLTMDTGALLELL